MAAQSGHAVAEYLLENKDWQNEYLIILQAEEDEFHNLVKKLELRDIKHSKFHEPDLDNSLTAIAVLNNQNLFRKFKPL